MMRRLVGALGGALAVAAACSPFAATADAPVSDDGGAIEASATPADASVSVDGTVCPTVDDTFDRSAMNIVESPWTHAQQDQDCSLGIQTDQAPDGSTEMFAQMTVAKPDDNHPAPTNAYLLAPIAGTPKSLTCTFRFRPDTDFSTGGPGLDFFIIEVDHADGTSALLRFSYKDGDLEIRDDLIASDESACSGSNCGLHETHRPATDIKKSYWSNITITTDFTSATVSSDETVVSTPLTDIGVPSPMRLRLGLVNFGTSIELGSFDDFHCTTTC